MNTTNSRESIATLFREITLSLIGLFHIYNVKPDLNEATAEVLRKLFSRHLHRASMPKRDSHQNPLHTLVDEIQSIANLEINAGENDETKTM